MAAKAWKRKIKEINLKIKKKSISEIKEIKLTLFEKINYNQRNQNQYEKHEVY